ncbi:hypothetical protein [Ensifer sp. ZNC0028]|nr:hypothetical protein [Ensifer sp. ZNC0028]
MTTFFVQKINEILPLATGKPDLPPQSFRRRRLPKIACGRKKRP